MESAKTCTSCGTMATTQVVSTEGEVATWVCSKIRCASKALYMVNIVENTILTRRANRVKEVSGF